MSNFKAALMDKPAMERALKRISHEILERNNGCDNICIIGIRRRGSSIAAILSDNIEAIEGVRVPTGDMDITFYRDDLVPETAEPVLHCLELPFDITEKNVILVDDVLYTGRTVRAAMDALMKAGRAASIQLAVLIDRGHRELPIRGDYVGKNIPTSRSERIFVNIPPYDEDMSVQLFE